MAKGGKAGPVVTDNGNFVIDAPFSEEMMRDPHEVRFFFLYRCARVKSMNFLCSLFVSC